MTGLPDLPKHAGVALARGVARGESLLKPAALPSTSGKTTVPSRTVTPARSPAPKAKAAVVAPKTPKQQPLPNGKLQASDHRFLNGPTPRPQSPEDAAAAAVTAALAPLYKAQGTQATGQNQAITNLTKAVIQALAANPGQIGGEYDHAIGQQTNLSISAADALRAANPNTQDQALLSAINAPQAQRDALAAQNSAVFNGGAAVGQYVGGVLPMDTLQSQKLAAMGIAHQQPVIEGLRGQQSLLSALNAQGVERAKIDAMRPDLIQRYTAASQSAQNAQVAARQKQQYLDMASQRLGLQAQGQGFNQKLAVTKLQRQQSQFLSRQQQQINLFNARQTTNQSKLALPNASLSSKVGYLVDSTGAPINGKITPLPGNRIVNGRIVKQGSRGRAAPRLTASQVQKFKGAATTIALNAKNGFDGKDPVTGKPKHYDPLPPYGAWQEMLKHGVPETIAIRAMNRAYGTKFNPSGFLP